MPVRECFRDFHCGPQSVLPKLCVRLAPWKTIPFQALQLARGGEFGAARSELRRKQAGSVSQPPGKLTTGWSRGSRHELRLRERRDAGFDSPQCLTVENPFPAGRALVEFQVGDRVGPSLEFAGPIPADLPYLIASASRTKSDVKHM